MPSTSMKQFAKTSECILKAEALWVLKSISSHYSFNSCEGIGQLFATMFPDSEVAEKFSCGADKAAYITAFGLGPHFQSLLTQQINKSEEFVLMFDESLNKEMGTKQLDLHQKKRKREDRYEESEGLKTKKRKLEKEATDLVTKADSLAEKAEHLVAIKLLVESNALRQGAKAKRLQIETISAAVEAAAKEIAGL